MRKLAFALFALSFAALPSAPASASCYPSSPCAAPIQRPAWNPCCNTGPAYWVQQIAPPCCYARPPAVVTPCCAQPTYHYRHRHRFYAPAYYRPHHRHHFRPYHRLVRPAIYRPYHRPFMRPHFRPHLRPWHRNIRTPMFRPHRPLLRPMHRVMQRPMVQPRGPAKLQPKKK